MPRVGLWGKILKMGKPAIISICNLGIALVFICLCVLPNRFANDVEWWGYDVMQRLPSSGPAPASPIVLVDIDDKALASLGPWPWPRSRLAEGIQKAAAQGAGLIGLPLSLDTPQAPSCQKALRGLAYTFKQIFGPPSPNKPKVKAFYQTLRGVRRRLDQDRLLADAMASAGNVMVPVELSGAPGVEAPSPQTRRLFRQRSREVYGIPQDADVSRVEPARLPLSAFLSSAHGAGVLAPPRDGDGMVRESRPVYRCGDRPVASFCLALAAAYLKIPQQELRMRAGEVLSFNGHRIALDAHGKFLVRFDPVSRALQRYSFSDLLDGDIPPQALSGKIVLFNLSGTGVGPRLHTPIKARMPMGELCAHTLWTLIQGDPVRRLSQERMTTLILVLLVGLFITFALPRLSLMRSGGLSLLAVMILAGASLWLFMTQRIWIQAVLPTLELTCGFLLTVLLTSFTPCAPKRTLARRAAGEMQRLQGLSLQSQGRPEAAWDRLRSLPVDEDMKGALYALALDFEKQGHSRKALSVYEHIETHDAEFRDIQVRMSRLVAPSRSMDAAVEPEEEPAVTVAPEEPAAADEPGEPTAIDAPGEPAATADPAQPQVPKRLGRYELIRPIGAGAMGTVYLGRDPWINRDTAIKTYRLLDGHPAAEAEAIKRRFFREAESAGKLSHPGIVTIFDAGEDDQLAYIAMELLEGRDLRAHVKKAGLLPMWKVIGYVGDIAEALAYAHRQGVVHRDIKPANLMLLKTGGVKITDFGIARIVATSDTRTGVVKGTPYYMAPEQITGKKVDGRSDIFSLGVVLFQLLTGQLPFTANTPTALMHKIVHDPHPDPKSLAPAVLTALVTVINLALEKRVESRYQDAGQMAAHLRQIGQQVEAVIARRKAMGKIHRK